MTRPAVMLALMLGTVLTVAAPSLAQNRATVAVDGAENELSIDQHGALAATVSVEQIGTGSTVQVVQRGAAQHAELRLEGSDHAQHVIQQGDGANRLFAEVAGSAHAMTIDQFALVGGANVATVVQGGSANNAVVTQMAEAGAINTILLEQFGTGNAADLTQHGSGNNMALTQVNDDNQATLVQIGDGLSLAIAQDGGGSIAVTQTGS